MTRPVSSQVSDALFGGAMVASFVAGGAPVASGRVSERRRRTALRRPVA